MPTPSRVRTTSSAADPAGAAEIASPDASLAERGPTEHRGLTYPLGRTGPDYGEVIQLAEGVGWTQLEGGPKLEFRAGDILWCPPEHKHWHGATPHSAMAHIAIQESLNGSPVTWMEHVTNEQYLGEADSEEQ